jgi:hypothetical protein
VQQSVNARRFFMKAVEAQFVLHKKYDEKTAGQSNGKPGDIDKTVAFVFEQIAHSDFEVVFEHGFWSVSGQFSLVSGIAQRAQRVLGFALCAMRYALCFTLNITRPRYPPSLISAMYIPCW